MFSLHPLPTRETPPVHCLCIFTQACLRLGEGALELARFIRTVTQQPKKPRKTTPAEKRVAAKRGSQKSKFKMAIFEKDLSKRRASNCSLVRVFAEQALERRVKLKGAVVSLAQYSVYFGDVARPLV